MQHVTLEAMLGGKLRIGIGTVLVGLAALIAIIWFRTFSHPPSATVKPLNVRLLLALQPTELFASATQVFSDELMKESGGSMKLSVLVPSDLGYSGDMSPDEAFGLMDRGGTELAAIHAGGIASKDKIFNAVNLPFLFKDYASAEKVLDSPLGQKLLESVDANTSDRGLAFTLGGGYRIIVSKTKQIKSAADFRGLRILTTAGTITGQTLRQLGAIPVPVASDDAPSAIQAASVDAIETVYTRLPPILSSEANIRYINETNHSLFLGAILASGSFYDSLTPEQQAILRRAALAAAQVEWEDSIAFIEKTKAEAEQEGVTVIPLTPQVSADLRLRLEPVYKLFEPTFSADFIKSIVEEQ